MTVLEYTVFYAEARNTRTGDWIRCGIHSTEDPAHDHARRMAMVGIEARVNEVKRSDDSSDYPHRRYATSEVGNRVIETYPAQEFPRPRRKRKDSE